jgi:hypothetical protein
LSGVSTLVQIWRYTSTYLTSVYRLQLYYIPQLQQYWQRQYTSTYLAVHQYIFAQPGATGSPH